MGVGSILKPEAVKVLTGVKSKKRLLQELGEMAALAYGVPAGTAVEALQDRETLGPTGVGDGVALPHARLGCLAQVVGVFVRLDKPLAFESVDLQPVDLVFALFAPDDAGVKHLKSLASVARAMREPRLLAKLRANDESSILHAILTDSETIKAA